MMLMIYDDNHVYNDLYYSTLNNLYEWKTNTTNVDSKLDIEKYDI